MSMHEIEDYIEEAIRVVSRSDMPVSEKRSMIYSLLRLEEYGDCGFTNLRTLKEMMDCQYTFVFDKTEMYDYEANRGYYDDLSKKGGCSQGAPYTLVARDAVTNEWVKHGDKVCIDSGSDAWRGMVAAAASPCPHTDPRSCMIPRNTAPCPKPRRARQGPPRRREACGKAARRTAAGRGCSCFPCQSPETTLLLRGTSRVTHVFAPMTDPAPMVILPRMVAPAYTVTSSSSFGWRGMPLMSTPSAPLGKDSAPSVTP